MRIYDLNRSKVEDLFKPEIFQLSKVSDKAQLKKLRNASQIFREFNTIESQIQEYIKCKNPNRLLTPKEVYELKMELLSGQTEDEFGVWVYYPWNGNLVHVLPEKEFIEVRTNRNQYKITPEERALLAQKRIGIIGLSVGQSVALTIAMERACGELRLADFDKLDLSNINRLRSGVHQIGINKAVLCAREIAEIDPYLKVTIYEEGLNENNIQSFFNKGGQLDLLIEECDGLDIKILARYVARSLKIPVIMETSDRGMLDIERFDLEPQRALLHGLVGDLNPEKLKGLSQEDKIQYLLPMVGIETISPRMKASLIEVQKSINSWPQLASDVVKGGGIAAEASRKLLLNQHQVSGRFYVDLDDIIGHAIQPELIEEETLESPEQINEDWLVKACNLIVHHQQSSYLLTDAEKEILIKAAQFAPSGGNTQPWKFAYKNGYILVFHDAPASFSYLDYHDLGAKMAIGAAIKNLEIAALNLQLDIHIEWKNETQFPCLIALISFSQFNNLKSIPYSFTDILNRYTNRGLSHAKSVSAETIANLKQVIGEYHGLSFHYYDSPQVLHDLGPVLAEAEMMVITNERGHADVLQKEIRWTAEEAESTGTGIDLRLLNLTTAQRTGLKVAKDFRVMKMIKSIGGGSAIKSLTIDQVKNSAGIGVLCLDRFDESLYVKAGMAMEHFWIEANKNGIGMHPIVQYLFLNLKYMGGDGLDKDDFAQFVKMRTQFQRILPELEYKVPFFLFRFTDAEKPIINSYRKKLEEIFIEIK
ncbi:MAG: Rv1355c family protein [Bacteroidia bacterium]